MEKENSKFFLRLQLFTQLNDIVGEMLDNLFTFLSDLCTFGVQKKIFAFRIIKEKENAFSYFALDSNFTHFGCLDKHYNKIEK